MKSASAPDLWEEAKKSASLAKKERRKKDNAVYEHVGRMDVRATSVEEGASHIDQVGG